MPNLSRLILHFLQQLPGGLDQQLRTGWTKEYFQEFAKEPNFGEDAVSPEARAVFSFLRKEAAVGFMRECGHRNAMPVFYLGLGQRWIKGQTRIMGVGTDCNFGQAFFSAVVEFLERFVLSRSSWGNQGAWVRAGTLPIASEFESHASRINLWLPVHSLFSGREVLLPAQQVFWDYDFAERAGEPRICEHNTSGAASGKTKSDAMAFGICELIERDALLLYWLKKIIPPRIALESIADEKINFLVNEARAFGLKPYILDITTDVSVPAYMAAFVRRNPPLVFRGFSANLNPLSAIKKALDEAWGSYIFNTFLLHEADDPAIPSVITRYKIWAKPSSFRHFEFLLRGPEIHFNRPAVNIKNELEVLVDTLRELGPKDELYCYESDHPILNELGVHVVKTVSSGLIPFYFFEENARFAHKHRRLRDATLNTYPHPMG